jgi:hypothetical protein
MLSNSQIGGAIVQRRMTLGDRTMMRGDALTAEQCRSIPRQNLKAFVNTGVLELFPASPIPEGSQRYAVHMGMGKFDVIEGRKLNTKPLTRAEADAMLPPTKKIKGRKTKKVH